MVKHIARAALAFIIILTLAGAAGTNVGPIETALILVVVLLVLAASVVLDRRDRRSTAA